MTFQSRRKKKRTRGYSKLSEFSEIKHQTNNNNNKLLIVFRKFEQSSYLVRVLYKLDSIFAKLLCVQCLEAIADLSQTCYFWLLVDVLLAILLLKQSLENSVKNLVYHSTVTNILLYFMKLTTAFTQFLISKTSYLE